MRLMEATRIGCEMYPEQAFLKRYRVEAACWQGAIRAAISTSIASAFPFLYYGPATCPECDHNESVLMYLGIHLNDDHRWTREQISAWISQYEPEPEPEVKVEVNEAVVEVE